MRVAIRCSSPEKKHISRLFSSSVCFVKTGWILGLSTIEGHRISPTENLCFALNYPSNKVVFKYSRFKGCLCKSKTWKFLWKLKYAFSNKLMKFANNDLLLRIFFHLWLHKSICFALWMIDEQTHLSLCFCQDHQYRRYTDNKRKSRYRFVASRIEQGGFLGCVKHFWPRYIHPT